MNQNAVLTRKDLEGLKAIATAFENIDDQKLVQIEQYLKEYKRKYDKSSDPNKQKKAVLADIMLKATSLKYIKERMAVTKRDMEEELSTDKETFIKGEINVFAFSSFDTLKEANLELVEEAYTAFMEANDFEEYHSDSPVRYLGELLQAGKNAYHGYQQIAANANRNEFTATLEDGKVKHNNEKEILDIGKAGVENDKVLDTIVLAYNGDTNPEKVDSEILSTENQIAKLKEEVFDLQNQYAGAFYEEEKAKKEIANLAADANNKEKIFKELETGTLSGDARKKANDAKSGMRQAFVELSKAYKDILESRNSVPPVNYDPFGLERESAEKVEELKKASEQAEKEQTGQSFIDDLLKEKTDNKAEKQALTDYFNFYLSNRKEENRWNSIKNDYLEYKSLFGHDPVMMNYLISPDDDLVVEGHNKLHSEYKASIHPEKEELYNKALQIKRRIMAGVDNDALFADYFSYDGKSSQKEFLQKLEERFEEKISTLKNARAEIPFEKDYREYVAAKEKRDTAQKAITAELQKGNEADLKVIEELQKDNVSNSILAEEAYARLKNRGIEDPENVPKIREYAENRLDAPKPEDYKKQIVLAERQAKNSKKYADKIRNAVNTVKNAKLDEKNPEMKALLDIIESGNGDYSKLPGSAEFMEKELKDYNTSVENGLKQSVMDAQKEMLQAKEKYAKAKEIKEAGNADKAFNKLGDKYVELEELKNKKAKLEQKKEQISKALATYRGKLEKPFADYEKKYEECSKLTASDEYDRIYKEIEKFRGDFDKCRRQDYIDGRKSNSVPYTNIHTALMAFGTREEFMQLSRADVSEKLKTLRDVAATYKAAKLDEVRPFWSHQRRFRLSYADRIIGFATTERALFKDVFEKTDENEKLRQIKEVHDKLELGNPATMTDKALATSLGASDKMDDKLKQLSDSEKLLYKNMKQYVEYPKKCQNENRPINKEALKTVLILMDWFKELKENLRDPNQIEEKGVVRLAAESRVSAQDGKNRVAEIEKDKTKNAEYDKLAERISVENLLKCNTPEEWFKEVQKAKMQEEIRTASRIEIKKAEAGDIASVLDNVTIKNKEVNAPRKPAPKPFKI